MNRPRRLSPDVARPDERREKLAAWRHRKMTLSAHAFVRGNARLFYEVVASRLSGSLPSGPHIWISADCHGENIGAVADPRGRAKLKMNDFDETTIGEPILDLVRLALSLAMAGRASGLGGLDIAHLLDGLVHGYCAELEARRAGADMPIVSPPRFRKLLKRAGEQTRTALFDHRVPRGPSGDRAFAYSARYWPLTDEEREALMALVSLPEVRHLVTTLVGADPELPVDAVDAAFRIAGTASLGAWRAAILVHVGNSKKRKYGDETLRLIDVKEALPSSAPRVPGSRTPEDDAARITSGALVLSPSIGGRMLPAQVLKRRVVVRELLPQDLKASLARLESDECEAVGHHLGAVIGRAHARQLTPADAASWKNVVSGSAHERVGPPRWLWDALVELVAVHEPAYLRHCAEEPSTTDGVDPSVSSV
ncbi:MAG: DUF2252 family protein [Deltaproteobacteria bacterium]|nr:DUF2252 family protein [Deltaproteobacteria bacterium]